MSPLSLGVIGTSAKENEHRLPLHPDHLPRLDPGIAARTTLEHGYADHFGITDDELDIGRWAHDATILALPTRILCRADCAGLCPVCGESLNDNPHEHEAAVDPRWSALKDLKLE